ncbi:histidine--tRNA ligase [Hyphomicrobium sp.]|uniref:histidine--tRNA ligase n=1 Tax=Hyphomicrobium sp. TaxID=82 RepID=UPI002BCFA0E1|nr:histidine--tRNA ligase [Hyphomicrobium sp.]HRN89837.1 histidine--tRNA ligase [Hyphomicrobium sp.]HRQ25423.1 histidine--tRNA ligase [Hyphomicrobium sp.]
MAKKEKDVNRRPAARLPKGMRDIGAAELRETQAMLEKIRAVYERYGFEPLETPAFEYTDSLGKFLPDQDRPNAGVFSFQDVAPEARDTTGNEQWLSLRYDLTAPLARHVAENFQDLPKPFRRYATGSVWRNEKPGPGRFRQFTQFDADTVGAESIAADAELCMLAADTLEALGIERGQYVIKVNNRKVLDGVLDSIGISGPEHSSKRLVVLRAIDKLDRLGVDGVKQLLGAGRKDESGDFTEGAGLNEDQVRKLIVFASLQDGLIPLEDVTDIPPQDRSARGEVSVFKSSDGNSSFFAESNKGVLDGLQVHFGRNEISRAGIFELQELAELAEAAGYGRDRIRIDPSVVRGLEYYTGPVFEAELLIPATDDKGNPVRFGSVGGGGRYDDLVARFTGQKVPATGFSIGVSRLQAALTALGRAPAPALGPVVVTVMDRDSLADYQAFVHTLRDAGIRAELYLGNPKKFGRQLEYADKRGSPVVVIQGSNEREAGEVILKDLIEGAKAAAAISDNKEWKEARPAQISVPVANLVEAVREILARHTPSSS